MSTTVDSLDIQITATSTKASKSIDQLVGKLNILSTSLKGINGSNLSGLANGVAKLGQSVQTLNGVKGSDYTRIANGLNKFSNINTSGMIKASSGLHVLSRGLSSIGNIQNLQNVTPTINAIKNLARVDMSGFDTTKLDAIQKSFTSFANSLSTVGDIDSKVTRLVNGMARLSGSGQYISNVTSEFPTLSRQVVKFAEDLQKVGTVDANVTKIVDGIARLASAGKKTAETVKNMDNLGNAVVKLLDKLRKYPNINANVANTIQGLGNLSVSGSRISSTVNGVSQGLKRFSIFGNRASKSSKGLASSIGLLYAKFWILLRAVKGLWGSVKSSQDYIEDFNYFAVALGKVAEDSKNQFKQAGFNSASEYAKSFKTRFSGLQKQMTGYIVDANTGNLTYGMSHNLGLDISQVMRFQSAITQITNSAGMLGETSIMTSKALSMLSADWSSLSNQNLSDVMQNMQSALIGQSRAVYKYGIDITSAGLAQTAYNHGLDISIKDLSQSSKMQLRLLTILDQSKVAYGDLARTINQPANQLRMLQAGFKNLSRTIGSIFMPIVQKLYPYLNAMVMVLQEFAEWIAKMTGVNLSNASTSISMPDYSDAADDSDNLASNTEKAANSAKKLSDNIQGFDVINKLQANDKDSSGDDNGGNGKNLDLSKQIANALGNYEKIWNKAFRDNRNNAVQLAQKIKSALLSGWRKGGNFTELGKSFAQWINKGLSNIPWKKTQKTINKLSRSLATFLNGAINGLNWSLVGETLAEGLNTVFGSAYTFVSTFNWFSLGNGIAEGINSAIKKADFKKAGKTLGSALRGIIQSAFGLLTNLNYAELGRKIADAINGFFNDMGEVRKNTGLTGWQELGISISSTIKGIADTLIKALQGVDWSKVGKAIVQFLTSIDWWGVLGKLLGVLATIIPQLFELAFSALKENPAGMIKSLSGAIALIFTVNKLRTAFSFLSSVFSNVFSGLLNTGLKNTTINSTVTTSIATKLKNLLISISTNGTATGGAKILGASIGSAIATEAAMILAAGIGSEIETAIAKATGNNSIQLSIAKRIMYSMGTEEEKQYVKYVMQMEKMQTKALSFDEWKKSISKNKKEVEDQFNKWDVIGKKTSDTTNDFTGDVNKLSSTLSKFGLKTKDSSKVIENLQEKLKNSKITFGQYRDIVDGNYQSSEELRKSINNLVPKSVKVEANTGGKDEVDKLKGSIDGVKDKNVSVKVNVPKEETKDKLGKYFSGLSGLNVTIGAKFAMGTRKLIEKEFSGWAALKVPIELGIKKEYKSKFLNDMKPLGMSNSAWEKTSLYKSLNKIPTYQTGGFPEDGFFMANHNELVGQFANGRTAVANNEQIVKGIAEGVGPVVYAAMKQAISEMPQQGSGDVYLDTTKVTKEIMGKAEQISRSRGSGWKLA